MSRMYCEHLVPISEPCNRCTIESDYLNAWEDGFAAARAWQALRDWLNGTPEQWQARCRVDWTLGWAAGHRAKA